MQCYSTAPGHCPLCSRASQGHAESCRSELGPLTPNAGEKPTPHSRDPLRPLSVESLARILQVRQREVRAGIDPGWLQAALTKRGNRRWMLRSDLGVLLSFFEAPRSLVSPISSSVHRRCPSHLPMQCWMTNRQHSLFGSSRVPLESDDQLLELVAVQVFYLGNKADSFRATALGIGCRLPPSRDLIRVQ